MSAGKICTRTTFTATRGESAQAAAKRMAEHDVGSLVVMDEYDRPVGIVTDRDFAVRLVANGLDAGETKVAEIMTVPLHAVAEETPIESTLSGMAGAGVRRSVVVDGNGKLIGIVALDDILELLAEEAEAVGALIRRQASS